MTDTNIEYDEFARGFALACALIMQTHRDHVITRNVVLSYGGFDRQIGLRDTWSMKGAYLRDLELIDEAFRERGTEHQRSSWFGEPRAGVRVPQ